MQLRYEARGKGYWCTLSVMLTSVIAPIAYAQVSDPIRGAGATFPGEVYSAWATGYGKDKKVAVQYQSVGSGEGIKRIVARQVDFGASDDPIKAEDLQKNGLMQFPSLIGGLVPAVNLRGIKTGELRLTGMCWQRFFQGRSKCGTPLRSPH